MHLRDATAVEDTALEKQARTVPSSASGAAADTERSHGRRARLVLAPLIVVLGSFLLLLSTVGGAFKGGPSGLAFEADFAMFLSAARITQHGGNPYDHNLLLRTDQSMLARQGLPLTKSRALVRVGNPPLFFWALEPLARFRFQHVALAWLALMCAFSILGFLASLRYLGWKRWLLPLIVFALMPQVLLGPYYGNIVCLVFAGIGIALALVKRHPALAGAVLSLALLKPPVALPIVVLIVLLHRAQWQRILAGFGIAVAALCVATGLAVGWQSLQWWMAAMLGYSSNVGMWPDMVSLAGLYVQTTGAHARMALEVVSLLAAGAVTVKLTWDNRGSDQMPIFAFAFLCFVWLLATPYAHPFDEVLLTVPMLILIGRDGHRVSWRWPAWSLYLMAFSLLLFPVAPFKIELLCIPVLAAALCLFLAGRDPRYGGAQQAARNHVPHIDEGIFR